MFIFLSKLFLAELFFALQKIIKPATEIKNNKKKYLFIIRIGLNGLNEIICREINNNVVEITISLTYFLSLANKELKANENFLYLIFNFNL